MSPYRGVARAGGPELVSLRGSGGPLALGEEWRQPSTQWERWRYFALDETDSHRVGWMSLSLPEGRGARKVPQAATGGLVLHPSRQSPQVLVSQHSHPCVALPALTKADFSGQ